MKTILIPTDLSAPAENAFSYAVDFALSVPEKISLLLLYVYDTNLANPDSTIDLVTGITEVEEQSIREQMEQMAAKYIRGTGLRCSTLTSRGFVENEINKVAQQYHADLILMGTKGASGLKATLFGSNTSKVVAHSAIPVLAIPEKTFFAPLRQIVVATDFREPDPSVLQLTVSLARHFNGSLLLVHFSEENEEELDLRVLAFMKNDILRRTGFGRIELQVLHTANFAGSLEEILRIRQANLLVMTPREKHSWYQKLYSPSRTRQMVLQTQLPLLTIPLNGSVQATDTMNGTRMLNELNFV